MRLVILAEERTPTSSALAAASACRGVESDVVSSADVEARTRLGDTLLGRIDVLPTLDGVQGCVWDLRRLEGSRACIYNPASALLAAHDKLMTALRLGRLGVPHPRTAHVDCDTATPELTLPVIVRPRFGSGGRDETLCDTRAELEDCLRQLQHRRWYRRQGALVQEVAHHSGPRQRLIVCRGEVVGAVELVRLPGERWVADIARRPPAAVSDSACGLAVRAVDGIGGDLVGVDLTTGDHGDLVLDLDAAVEFTTDYSLSQNNIFDRVAELLLPNGPIDKDVEGVPAAVSP